MTTQQVFAKYTELYDISTDIGKNVHYKIHTPTGVSHMRKLAGLYKQFKEYKYLGATIAWVPITTLPKDLLGVSYEAGENTVDPRDLINPILHKGYKGESLITDFLSERALWTENEDATDAGWQGDATDDIHRIRRMTESGGVSKIGFADPQSDYSNDIIRGMYYTSLTDSEWAKAHPREGFYTELFPLVRTLASTARIGPTGVEQSNNAVPWQNNDKYKEADRDINSLHTMTENTDGNGVRVEETNIPNSGLNMVGTSTYNGNMNYQSINQTDVFTHEFERLGWMETSGKGNLGGTILASATANSTRGSPQLTTDLDLNRMPKVYMYLVQTPPAYKTKQYYRMSITHSFAFRKFRQVYGLDMPNVWSDTKITGGKPMQTGEPIGRGYEIYQKVAGKAMYDESGTYHDDDFEIPKYEPALENTIEADGEANITKISDGVF